jgi:hypothetical protein
MGGFAFWRGVRSAHLEESSSGTEGPRGSHRADASHEHGDDSGEGQSREFGRESAFLHEKSLRGAGAEQPSEHAAPMNTPESIQSTSPEAAQPATVVRWGAAGLATEVSAATPSPVMPLRSAPLGATVRPRSDL